WLHSLGRLINVEWLQHIELASSIELIFGLILVFMMLYRREGLIPATRRVAPLTTEEQTAAPTRGGFEGLEGLGALDERHDGPLLDIAGLTVRVGGLVALREVPVAGAAHSLLAGMDPH